MNHFASWKPLFLTMFITLALIACVDLGYSWLAEQDTPEMASTWAQHREACLKIPDQVYREDHSRMVKGQVRDAAGKPVAGSLIRSLSLERLSQLAKSGQFSPSAWSNLVETETRSDAKGEYEFPHLSEGSRMLCISSPGLAPTTLGPIVVQDGSGARGDTILNVPETLHIKLKDGDSRAYRLYLVPHRWWPELISREVAKGETKVEISGLGGAYQKGLILISESDKVSDWKVVGIYDLTRTQDVVVSVKADTSKLAISIPEAACLAPWGNETSGANRLFFSILSPVALFWKESKGTSLASKPPEVPKPNAQPEAGITGYTRHPFLPVLIESQSGGSWVTWTSKASEFELLNLSGGNYRIRSLNAFGQVTFARGLVVPPKGITELESVPGDAIDLKEPLGREVMGLVRGEDGLPVEGAEVFVQDSSNFRRFLQRVTTDRNGSFHASGLHGNGNYFAFAVPSKDEHAMKHFQYFNLDQTQREIWLDLRIYPHKIVGQLENADPSTNCELVVEEPNGRLRNAASASPDGTGQFAFSNVPHGHYRVRTTTTGPKPRESSPIVVEHELQEVVQWLGSSPAPPRRPSGP